MCKKAREELSLGEYTMLWDMLAMAVAIDNDMIINSQEVYATVETHGQLTRGAVVIDWLGKLQKEPNVRLVMSVKQEKFQELLYSGIR